MLYYYFIMENISLVCTNKKVLEFYKEHPNLDFEAMNIIFVDIMLNLSQDMNSSLSNNIAAQLLSNVKSLQTQVNSVSDSLNKMQVETINSFGNKFNDFKKEYFEDVKMILSQEELDELNWEPFVKRLMKNEVDMYLDSDKDIIQNNMRIINQKEKLAFLEEVIKNLNQRNFQIKNAIEWKKFTQGVQ